MPMAAIFWVLMLIWLIFGLYSTRDEWRTGKYGGASGSLLLFVLLFLLGWKVFGFPIQG